MQHEYRIDDKEGIVYLSFRGECTIHDLETMLLSLTSDIAFSPDYDDFVDLREGELKFRPVEMLEFFQNFKDTFRRGRGKSVFLVDTPLETAISFIHRKTVEDAREVHVFSTYEAAMKCLKGDL